MNNMIAKLLQALDKPIHCHYETSAIQAQWPVEFSL